MKEEIINNINYPVELEKLYRDNKTAFKSAFNSVYPEISSIKAAQVWHARLNFENEEISWGTRKELLFVITASVIAGLVAKIPAFAKINEENFYQRNLGFIVFPLLAIFFLWKHDIKTRTWLFIMSLFIISAVFINLLPGYLRNDTLILSCIHLPILLWTITGYCFAGADLKNYHKRLDFLRYNGDLLVMTAIILIAGGILAGITMGLFSLISIDIQNFYIKYIITGGLAATPIIATYLVRKNPHLVSRVSPVIAKVFTPLVLITLVVYLVAILVIRKDPYNDRDFLLIFNLLLIGVMAIILFSIAEMSKNYSGKAAVILLFALSIVTIIINGIALSAILFRISEWGITPNRLAVLGGNGLILSNLTMVSYHLFKAINDSTAIEKAEKSIAVFLPVYSLWAAIVTFIFPFIFNISQPDFYTSFQIITYSVSR